jgi:histidine ammonia-lyase
LTLLQQYLQAIKDHREPASWQAALPTITAEAVQFEKILATQRVPIYGATTRVGHRDQEPLSPLQLEAFHRDFLSSHTLGSEPWYGEAIARHIGYAKMYAFAAGGSGISAALYQTVAASLLDKTFAPQVPQGCSYSCGDVIPGAHWAQALLSHNAQYRPRAGEVMALLNGSFVHVGYTLALLKPLSQLGALLIETTRINNYLVAANRVNFAAPVQPYAQPIVQHIAASLGASYGDYSRQDPISVRATPQIMETWVDAGRSLYEQLDYQLRSPSNNPLFSLEIDYPLSQASFLAPSLSLKTEAVIEAILFALWASVNRTQYLLSGQVATIPQDGANAQSALQFIQYPKLMMSHLERCRQTYGRRVFAAGAQTSNGLEDLWTYGVDTTAQLEGLCAAGTRLLATELWVLLKAAQLFEANVPVSTEILATVAETTSAQNAIERLLRLVAAGCFDQSEALLADALLAEA